MLRVSIIACCLLAFSGSAWGQSPIAPVLGGNIPEVVDEGKVYGPEGKTYLYQQNSNDIGVVLPDIDGGYVYIPGPARPAPSPGTLDAQELKLKARELAAQLLDTWPNDSLTGMVALPTSFVSLHNFNETSPLGRYLSEALIYEFNTRGFAVREYRLNASIDMVPGKGEFVLSRSLPNIKLDASYSALIVGTYIADRDNVIVNARMVRPLDGLVLRTAQLIIPITPTVNRMVRQPALSAGTLRITSGK